MTSRLLSVCGFVLMTTLATTAVRAQSPQHDDEGAPSKATLAPTLVGAWKAPAEKTALSTEFDVSVWGPGASAVRDVSLTVTASGAATLTVTRKVLDARGRVKPASTSIEEAELSIDGPRETVGPRIEHGVKVVHAERRFPDDPKDTWSIEGLRVRVVSFADAADTIEVRFDTPEGRGSFWQTLARQKR